MLKTKYHYKGMIKNFSTKTVDIFKKNNDEK